MAISGISISNIVRNLNSREILTPVDYARVTGLQGNYEHGNGLWNTRSVKYILTNPTYTGDLVQGKTRYKAENTHEPLVSRDVFDEVQRIFTHSPVITNGKTNTPNADNILRGKVICGSCGSKMQRRKGSGTGDWHFFTCITNNRMGNGHCTGMYIRESDIMAAMRLEIARYVRGNKSLASERECNKSTLMKRMECLNDKLQDILDNARTLYEQYVSNIISVDEYLGCKGKHAIIKTELCDVESQISALDNAQEQYQLFCGVNQSRHGLEQLVNKYLKTAKVHADKRLIFLLAESHKFYGYNSLVL